MKILIFPNGRVASRVRRVALYLGNAGIGSSSASVDPAGGYAERSPGQPIPAANVLTWHAGDNARVMMLHTKVMILLTKLK
jgi:hypothetical protein